MHAYSKRPGAVNRNAFHIAEGVAVLTLTDHEGTPNATAKVSPCDIDRVIEFGRWSVNPRRTVAYVQCGKRVDGRMTIVRLHRFIMDAPEGLEIDHINGDGTDNRRENLRVVTRSQNLHNRRNLRESRYGMPPNVRQCPQTGCYEARVMIDGKQYSRRCKSVDEAVAVAARLRQRVFESPATTTESEAPR